MGGNALKVTQTRRYDKAEYEALVVDVLSVLQPLLPGVRLTEVKAYTEKSSFGDLDLVVEDLDNVRETLKTYLDDNGHEVVIDKPKREHKASKFRAPTWSVSWNGDFQVDFLFQPKERYDFACFYYHYPDLGNFLGHMARKFGMKMGHKGLYLRLYDGTNLYDEVLVSMDVNKVLRFLGYDPEPAFTGFRTAEDIFAYAASSPYFDPKMFDLKTASYKDRVRDSKRPMYNGLLAWIADKTFYPVPMVPELALQMALEKFDGFAERKAEAEANYQRSLRVRERFHGRRVTSLTGLEGKELGLLMNAVRNSFGSKEELYAKIDCMSDEDLDALILSFNK